MGRPLLPKIEACITPWLYVIAFPFVALVIIPYLTLKMLFLMGKIFQQVARPGGVERAKKSLEEL